MPVTQDSALLWKAGRLRYKLHADQRLVYDKYKAWRTDIIERRRAQQDLIGENPLIWITDCSRRWGKDYFGLTIAHEDAINNPGAILTYGTAYLKDLGNVIVPLSKQIADDCPPSLRPVYRESYRGTSQGLYFPNGSVLKFVGIDKNPDGLRGQASDGVFLTEGAFCDYLEDAIENVLKPQLIGRAHATIMMNSTPPVEPTHAWDRLYVPDAKDRGAYVLRTIDDAPQYTDAEKRIFIGKDGGIKSEKVQREYYCVRVRSETLTVIPEFDKVNHVKEFEIPEFAQAYVSIDPGFQDLCAVNLAVRDFEHDRVLIVDEWTKRNANDEDVIEATRGLEKAHLEELKYWNGSKLCKNPYLRISDTDPQLLARFKQQYNMDVGAADKNDTDAHLHALRVAIGQGKILIHPRCKNTIEHLEGAVWNKQRSTYLRTPRLGHADHVDALKYLWRHVDKKHNPFPPHAWRLLQKPENDGKVFTKPEYLKTPGQLADKLSKLFSHRSRARR